MTSNATGIYTTWFPVVGTSIVASRTRHTTPDWLKRPPMSMAAEKSSYFYVYQKDVVIIIIIIRIIKLNNFLNKKKIEITSRIIVLYLLASCLKLPLAIRCLTGS